MITNSSITVYHKGFDKKTRTEKWTRFNYDKVWFFGGKGAGLNKGYENSNDFACRISYQKYSDLDVSNFAIGDLVVQESLDTNITTQEDLKGHLVYTIRSITNNNFGNNRHIHIGGK